LFYSFLKELLVILLLNPFFTSFPDQIQWKTLLRQLHHQLQHQLSPPLQPFLHHHLLYFSFHHHHIHSHHHNTTLITSISTYNIAITIIFITFQFFSSPSKSNYITFTNTTTTNNTFTLPFTSSLFFFLRPATLLASLGSLHASPRLAAIKRPSPPPLLASVFPRYKVRAHSFRSSHNFHRVCI